MIEPIFRDVIGGMAALLTTLSFVPQALQIIRSRNTSALSLPMYLAFGLGIALWLVYGIMLVSWPIIASNVVTLVLVSLIILLKLRYG